MGELTYMSLDTSLRGTAALTLVTNNRHTHTHTNFKKFWSHYMREEKPVMWREEHTEIWGKLEYRQYLFLAS